MNTMIQKLCILLSACLMGTFLSAQVPSITGFAPTFGPIGTTVTITGTNFNTTAANNIVYFGPVRATVNLSTATTLTVVVPSGANYQAISVLNTATGLHAQSTLPFKVTFSSGINITTASFAAKVDSVTASRPSGLAVGDMDGDGKSDLIMPHSISQAIRIYLNNNTGNAVAFKPRFTLTLNAGATGVAVEDLDGDGKLDIAAVSSTAGRLFLFRNTTTGNTLSFAPRIDSVAGSSAQAIAIGDLDLDGKPDLAIANSSAGTVSVLRNTSTPGNLSFASRVTFAVGSQPFTLGVGDMDGDGKLDVVSGNAQSGTISVLRNTNTNSGTLSLAAKVDFDAGGFPFGTTLADIDGDGKLDVMVVDQGVKLSILRNTSISGMLSFATKVDFTTGVTGAAPIRIAAGDLDGDGKVDIAVSNNGANAAAIFKNNSTSGSIALATRIELTTGTVPFANAIADLTGDDQPDFIVINQNSNTVSVFRTQLSLPPSIVSFSPMTGGPGDTIVITGNNLATVNKVTFGDSVATYFQVVDPLHIKAVVGTGATGSVSVFIPNDTLTLPGFVYTNCPTTLVTITAMPGDTICPGDSATFKASAVVADTTATLEWYLNGDLVGTDTVLTIDTLAHLDTIICIVRDTCGVAPRSDSDTIIMHLRTLPTLTSTLTPPAICSGTAFAYTPTSNVVGTTYQWRRKAVTGISNAASTGMGPINETLNDTTANPVMVTYEIFKLTAGGCLQPDTFKVKVQVNPIPKLSSSVAADSVCSGATFTYNPTSTTTGATITWSRAFVNGISNSGNMGTGAISESLNNTGASSVNVIYRFNLAANGCTKPVTDSLILTVSPIPQVTSATTAPAICSGTAFTYVPASNLAGATFKWTRMAVTGISNATRMDTGRINEILFDTTANPVNAIYQYTAIFNGCNSTSPVNVTVAVNPSPLISSTLNPAAICSGATFAYMPTSNNNNVSFTWTRAAVNGISNAAANGTGAVSETLTNTTADTVAVVYAYVISASGCSDPNPKNVTVLVKPLPTLSSITNPPAVCSGTAFTYIPTSATEGTTFSWTRAAVTGISNASAMGTGNPNEILIDTTSAPVNVAYIYTLSAHGCTNPEKDTVDLTINQPPSLSSSQSPAGICSGAVFNYMPTSAVQNTTFSWTRAAVQGISNTAGSGTGNPNEALTNTTGLPINVTYVYTLSAGGCANPQTFNVVVSVRPYPTLISETNPAAICSGNAFTYTPISGDFDATFTWTRTAVNGISNLAANGNNDPNEVLENTTTNAINVVYAFTVSSGGCSNPNPVNVTVSVKPSPRLTSSVNVSDICSGATFNYTPTSNVANTTFAWTRATVDGISNAAGSGNGPINEVLTSTAELSLGVFYQYTLTANGCAAALPSTIEVTVKPLPVLSSATIAPDICSGEIFSYLPKSLTQGTDFSWTRAAVQGISAAAASGTGNPAEVLTNTTNGPLTVVYVYHLSANSCSNPVGYNVEVEVNPLPVLTSASSVSEMCSGQIFNYTPTSTVPSTTFNWTRAVVAGINNTAGSGTGNPNEALENTSNAPVTVTYVYSLNVGGCVNTATYTVTVVVNPKPTLNSTVNPPAICSGAVFNYTPSSSTTGATFSWSRQAVTGISNAVANGTGNPNETLTNTTANPINVTYVYLISANACANTISNSVVVTVNPLPTLSSELALDASCSGSSFTYLPTSATANTSFAWSRATVQGISNAAATGTGGISESLTSTSNTTTTVSYVFTLSANGCSNPATFTVNKLISPIPNLTSSLNPFAICSGATLTYTPNSNVSGTTYTWTRAAVQGISNPAADGSGDINEVLLNTTTGNLNVVYQYSLSANGCNNPNAAQVTVAVNAKPIVVTHNPAPRCTTLVNLQDAAVTAGSTPDLTFTYWTDAAITLAFNTPQSADAGIYYIKGTTSTGCFDVKPVTVVVGRIPDVSASGKTICSGIPADITVLNPNAAPGATFNWTATYGKARLGLGSGTGVPFGVNAIDELLINLTRARTEVTYTITPVGAQASGCIGEPIKVVVKVNSGGKRCPEAEPTAFRETIAHNTAPQTKVNMVKPKKKKKYLVQAISNPDSVKGVSEAPYTRPRGSVFEENALQNPTRQPATVVYTIVPYTNGRNWRDNNGGGDDVLGASFDVVVTVQGGPGFTEPALPEIAAKPNELEQQGAVNKPAQLQKSIAPALLDYMVEAAQQPAAEKVVLLQNVPNPFQGNTQIGFYLPEGAQAKLSIRDVKGAVLYQVQGNYSKGWNLLELSAVDLRVSGVLYYSLETAKFVETKRMVVLK